MSGVRHIAELSAMPLKDKTMLYDFTSSGLTHSYNGLEEEFNPYRISPLIKSLNYGGLQLDWEHNEITLFLNGDEGQQLYKKTILIR